MPISLSVLMLGFSRGLWWFLDYNGGFADGRYRPLEATIIIFCDRVNIRHEFTRLPMLNRVVEGG